MDDDEKWDLRFKSYSCLVSCRSMDGNTLAGKSGSDNFSFPFAFLVTIISRPTRSYSFVTHIKRDLKQRLP